MSGAKPGKPVQRGPQVGAPPSLEQVPLDRLSVDPAYQRATDGPASRRIIRRMIQEWNWSLCQPLSVSRRAGGALFVLDGQHRLQGARERGDILYLPCVIASNLDRADEANTFVKLNTERQKLGENDVFIGLLSAGDEHAVRVQTLLDAAGWTLARHRGTHKFKPGELLCAPLLVKMLKARGEGAVRFALSVLRAAYPETRITITATLLAALGQLFDDADAAGSYTAADLIAAIGAQPPHKWLAVRDRRIARFPALSQQTALAQVLLAAARGDAEPAAIAAPIPSTGHPAIAARSAHQRAIPAQRSPAAPRNPFGLNNKGWCDQCDQLRSRQHASACADQFCSLRAFA